MIRRYSCSYSGEALFDDSYADVVRNHWGVSSQLLAWAVVAMVWAHPTPAHYQILGVFGAMSAAFVCWVPPRQLGRKLPTRYLPAALAGFASIFMLPLASSALSFGLWLKLLHLALLVPKFMWDKSEVDATATFLVLAILSVGVHYSVPPSVWPKTPCQISITCVITRSLRWLDRATWHAIRLQLQNLSGPHACAADMTQWRAGC